MPAPKPAPRHTYQGPDIHVHDGAGNYPILRAGDPIPDWVDPAQFPSVDAPVAADPIAPEEG